MSSSDSKGLKRGTRHNTESTRCNESLIKTANEEQAMENISKKNDTISFGPALPTHLQKNNSIEPAPSPCLEKTNLVYPALPPHLKNSMDPTLPPHFGLKDSMGPTLLPHFEKKDSIGPTLPFHLEKKDSMDPTLPSYFVDRNLIGPTLPSHLKKKDSMGPTLPLHFEKREAIGPALPSHLAKKGSIGPTLPPHLQCNSNEDTPQVVGPALPPNLENKSSIGYGIVGPVLPPHLQKPQFGPALPDFLKQQLAETCQSDEEDEDIHGPMPVGASQSRAHLELEERALQMKIDLLNPSDKKEPGREEWMLELPEVKAANFGLGNRQFRAKEAPDLSNRSSWTDTPEDRAKKREGKNKDKVVDVKREAEIKEARKRDREQEAIAKKHKRNKESLVELHMKKKKKDDASGSSERRPFSRDVDLQVNKFDEAQKKAVLKKAQLLDTRFSAGESKFL